MRTIIVTYPNLEEIAELDEIQGKFVQFTWQGAEYLLFATKVQHRFHNQMLAHFMEDHAIPHRWLDDQNLEVGTDSVEIIGGGRFLYRRGQNLLELWDNSQAYGRFNEAGLDAKIHDSAHPWSSARVSIR